MLLLDMTLEIEKSNCLTAAKTVAEGFIAAKISFYSRPVHAQNYEQHKKSNFSFSTAPECLCRSKGDGRGTFVAIKFWETHSTTSKNYESEKLLLTGNGVNVWSFLWKCMTKQMLQKDVEMLEYIQRWKLRLKF